MPETLVYVLASWSLGFLSAWIYFKSARLIRTRKEWYADRRQRGLSVPADWTEE